MLLILKKTFFPLTTMVISRFKFWRIYSSFRSNEKNVRDNRKNTII